MDIAKTVYLLAREVGGGCNNPIKLFLLSSIECASHHVYRLFQAGVIPPQALTANMDIGSHVIQLFTVLFSCFHYFKSLLYIFKNPVSSTLASPV